MGQSNKNVHSFLFEKGYMPNNVQRGVNLKYSKITSINNWRREACRSSITLPLFSVLQVNRLKNYCNKCLFFRHSSPSECNPGCSESFMFISAVHLDVSPRGLKWVLASFTLPPGLILMNKSPSKICEAPLLMKWKWDCWPSSIVQALT